MLEGHDILLRLFRFAQLILLVGSKLIVRVNRTLAENDFDIFVFIERGGGGNPKTYTYLPAAPQYLRDRPAESGQELLVENLVCGTLSASLDRTRPS